MTSSRVAQLPGSRAGNAVAFYLDRHIDEGRGDQAAIHSAGETISYAMLKRSVNKVAAGLATFVDSEQRVALIMNDSPLLVSCIWAILRLGAVPVPLSTRLSERDYAFIFADCRPTVTIVEQELLASVAVAQSQAGFPSKVIVSRATASAINVTSIDDILTGVNEDPPFRPTSLDECAVIQYTSGSTGEPKGVVHVHRALIELQHGFARRIGLNSTDVCFSAPKVSFGYGFGNSLLFPATVAASTILCPDPPNAIVVQQVIETQRPTVLFGVPSLYSQLLNLFNDDRPLDLSSVRICISAGEHLSSSIFELWKTRFGVEIIDGIGATECLHIFMSPTPGDVVPGSTGTPVAGCDVQLRDEAGRIVPEGTPGHVEVRSSFNGARYWNREDETKQTFLGEWVRTGDVMIKDGSGQYTYVGRSDDILKVGGHKVAPSEIETCLLQHPAVAEVAVVAKAQGRDISSIVAYVRTADEVTGTRDLKRELREHMRQSLASFKIPHVIEWVSELPRTVTGKVRRHLLRAGTTEAAPDDVRMR